MKINDDEVYHGAALTQIAELPRFSAINTLEGAQDFQVGLQGER